MEQFDNGRVSEAAGPVDQHEAVDPDEFELVTPQEIATRLGLPNHRVVLEWRFRRKDFPAPATRRRTYLWRWGEVASWARINQRELDDLRR